MNAENEAGRLGSTKPDQETELDGIQRVSININERVGAVHGRLNDLLNRLGTPLPPTEEPNIQQVPEVSGGHLGRINDTTGGTLGTLDEISKQLAQLERFA